MTINMRKNTIEMSKKFAAAAKRFGTEEYKQLQEARRDYPDFKVVTATRKSTAKKESYKGLTYEYMEKYIRYIEGENASEVLKEFAEQRLMSACHSQANRYLAVKDWFLKKYPEIVAFHEKRNTKAA